VNNFDLKRALLAGTSMGALMVMSSFISTATADDFVVDTDTFVQNGDAANVLDGNDSLTVTSSGSITFTGAAIFGGGGSNTITNSGLVTSNGDFSYGIYVDGTGNTIVNTGTIVQTGAIDGSGIHAEESGSISNSGSISTIGVNGSHGIEVFGVHTIVNSGAISTNGNQSSGIFVDSLAIGSTVDNSGTISTRGGTSHGIYALGGDVAISNTGEIRTTGVSGAGINSDSDRGKTVNSGVISTTGDFAFGIFSGGIEEEITNSGSISTAGNRAFGIYASRRDAKVTNSGAIVTTGAVAHGILSTDNRAEITNSGKIVAADTSADALRILVADSMLSLLAPSFVGGAITIAPTATVNITTGPSHSVLWTFTTGVTPDISGPVPGFFDAATGQFATYDPTALAAAEDQLGELTGLISDLAARKTSEDDAWIAGFGSVADVDGNGTTLDRDLTNGGLAVGANRRVNDAFRVGGMVGYAWSAIDASSRWTKSQDNKSNGFFARANGQIALERFYVDLGLSAGTREHDGRRFVNDNLALTNGQTLGQSWATSDYMSWWISPEIAVSTDITGPDGWTMTPLAQLRYAFEAINGYSETGSDANATVASRNLGLIQAKVELAASKTFGTTSFTARAGFQSRNSVGDDSATVTLLDLSQSVSNGSENQYAGYVGADAGFMIGTATLNIAGKALIGNHITSASASATLSHKF